MAARKVKVLEGELGQLEADFEEKIADFQNQIASVNERMEGRFAVVEDMLKKLLEAKLNPTTSEAKETTGSHGRSRNPNTFRGRENLEAEILEGEGGIPPLEPLSREEMSMATQERYLSPSGNWSPSAFSSLEAVAPITIHLFHATLAALSNTAARRREKVKTTAKTLPLAARPPDQLGRRRQDHRENLFRLQWLLGPQIRPGDWGPKQAGPPRYIAFLVLLCS
ncbi:hypothetical protein M5K25_011956 [Dendrobium thyrsiflorum]|uniref:Uncharacterized protein n=1 Tax=Dendrobium thyrsiflorum TaxID=117978 RepID=A0ABD0V3N6_DENTH